MWRGWTRPAQADAYERYLREDLFPRLDRELRGRGYRGFDILRRERDGETEFVTLVWFASLTDVRGFAGDDYETPVISPTAAALLSRYAPRCDHYALQASDRKPA
jgi:hypothetical protein